MKVNFKIISILSFVVLLSCSNNANNPILGQWVLVETGGDNFTSDSFTIPVSKNEKRTKNDNKVDDIVLIFNDESNVNVVQFGEPNLVKYKKSGDVLLLGTTEYKILKINNDSLVLSNNEGFITTTYTYIKKEENK